MRLGRTVSFSEMEMFHKCRQAWHYRYNEGLVPLDTGEQLLMGQAVHHYMAAEILWWVFDQHEKFPGWLGTYLDRVGDSLFSEELVSYLFDLDKTAAQIAHRAGKYLGFDKEDCRWGPVWIGRPGTPAVEYMFTIKHQGTAGVKGIFDWIAQDKEDGSLWLWEHKTRKSLSNEDGAGFCQLPLYQYMAKQMGLNIMGSVVLQMLPVLPESPKQNKNGSMSRSLIRSDWETYRKALADAELDPADYEEEMKPKLDAVEWFRLEQTIRSDAEIEAIWKDIFLPSVRDIADKRKRIVRSRASFNCGKCDFRRICEAELFGDDAAFVRETHYTVDQSKVQG